MANAYMTLINGIKTLVQALVSTTGVSDAGKIVATDANGTLDPTLMPGGSPVNTSAGAGDAGKLPKLDAAGKLDSTMMPAGVELQTRSVPTSDNLAAGDIVNLWQNAGTTTARKAVASDTGKQAHGYVMSATTAPAAATVFFGGTISGLSGLTPGPQFLSATAGRATATCPSTGGYIAQNLGYAPSATELIFKPSEPATLA